MRWLDVSRLAVNGLARRPARTGLTVLGVGLGSSLLVALGSIASVAESRAVEHFGQGLPVGAIKVAPAAASPSQLQSDEFEPTHPLDIDEGAVEQIRRIPDVKTIVPLQVAPVLVVPPGASSFVGAMVGTDMSLGPDVPVSVLAGRLPKAGSLTEVAVTQGYLDKTGATAQSSVDKEVQLAEPRAERGSALPFRPRWIRALIVGVVSQDIPSADLLVPLEQTRAARAWERSGGAQAIFATQLGVTASPYTGVIVVATSVDTMHAVREGIDALGYATSAPEKILGAILRYLHVVDIVLAGIGSIALFVAGLNIANALLAAVRERRREIGVLKAIGARDSDVLRWFLVEAALTGLAGGIAGTLIGALLAQVLAAQVTQYLSEQGILMEGIGIGDLPVAVLVAGVLGSALLAMVAAMIPALRAARLPAREAVSDL